MAGGVLADGVIGGDSAVGVGVDRNTLSVGDAVAFIGVSNSHINIYGGCAGIGAPGDGVSIVTGSNGTSGKSPGVGSAWTGVWYRSGITGRLFADGVGSSNSAVGIFVDGNGIRVYILGAVIIRNGKLNGIGTMAGVVIRRVFFRAIYISITRMPIKVPGIGIGRSTAKRGSIKISIIAEAFVISGEPGNERGHYRKRRIAPTLRLGVLSITTASSATGWFITGCIVGYPTKHNGFQLDVVPTIKINGP